MTFTIGHTQSYELGFAEFSDNPEEFKKMGKREDYCGGSVFLSKEAAEVYLSNNGITDYSVYGVLADWKKDTEPNDHGEFNNLLIDAQLVNLT